ncbi:MAG: hypothetical protein JXQ72_08180 [Anaerolineae bacterium]|nr:hypothetical protein [Anaerolineae bacterium]
MADQDINYPDVLGFVTGGPRLTQDVVQCALAARPGRVPAGKTFDLLLLVQNASDIDVDVILQPELPARDLKNQQHRFDTKTNRLVVGLRPAEVGYVTLPVTTSPTTEPGQGYLAGVRLEVKRMDKKRKPQRVRGPQGGGRFVIEELANDTQQQLKSLQELVFSVNDGGKKSQVVTPFVMQPPSIASLKEAKPGWTSLWTVADYADDYIIARKVRDTARQVVQQARRETVFMPLLKATQAKFQACSYPLTAPEAICITKILTLLLEMGVVDPTPETPRPAWPRWYTRLCRLLNREAGLAEHPAPLITQYLYNDLVHDSVIYGFTMVGTVTNENFGSPEETGSYADDIVDVLENTKPLDFARAYFPLILAGLIANARVTMPNEQIRETVFILSKAVEKRRAERTPDNAFIFDIANRLIERALDSV